MFSSPFRRSSLFDDFMGDDFSLLGRRRNDSPWDSDDFYNNESYRQFRNEQIGQNNNNNQQKQQREKQDSENKQQQRIQQGEPQSYYKSESYSTAVQYDKDGNQVVYEQRAVNDNGKKDQFKSKRIYDSQNNLIDEEKQGNENLRLNYSRRRSDPYSILN